MAEIKSFEGALLRPEGVGTWIYVDIPFDVESAFGKRGQIRVKGTVNGAAYRSTLMPRGDGTHYLVVGGELRESAGAAQGDKVKVTVSLDSEERTVEVPDDLQAALECNQTAQPVWERLAYSHRKEYVAWIEGAKREETRRSRIAKAMLMLAEGKKLKS